MSVIGRYLEVNKVFLPCFLLSRPQQDAVSCAGVLCDWSVPPELDQLHSAHQRHGTGVHQELCLWREATQHHQLTAEGIYTVWKHLHSGQRDHHGTACFHRATNSGDHCYPDCGNSGGGVLCAGHLHHGLLHLLLLLLCTKGPEGGGPVSLWEGCWEDCGSLLMLSSEMSHPTLMHV